MPNILAITRAAQKAYNKEELKRLKADAKAEKGFYYLKPLKTLDTKCWFYDNMPKGWKSGFASPENIIERIIRANRRAFDFLGIKAWYENVKGKHSLIIQTSKHVGCVPLCSPISGGPIGDLQVIGRYNESVGELMSLIECSLKIDYNTELHLVNRTTLQSPLYLECIKFIEMYLEAEHLPWQKFESVKRYQAIPCNSTDWTNYLIKSATRQYSSFPFLNKKNILTREHEEQWQINFVLNKCLNVVDSKDTPVSVRNRYYETLRRLKNNLHNAKSKYIKQFRISKTDTTPIRNLKAQANIVLEENANQSISWRIDYSEFFERFVQYLFGEVAKTRSAKTICNPHFSVSSNRPTWALHYLEPDLILQKEQTQYVVDAKYKSHIFNWNDYSDDLHDTFRHDLHQILAYCSFNQMTTKNALLIYPFSDFVSHKLKAKSPLTNSEANIYLIGIPLEKSKIEEVKEKLNEIVNF